MMKYYIGIVCILLASTAFCLPAGTWTKIANENEDFTLPLPGFRVIRYGDGTNWRYFQDSGYGTCSRSYFGWYGSPAPTECHLFTPTESSTATKPKNGGPLIDVTKIPPSNGGYSELRIQHTDEQPAASGDGIGAFRISCGYSHMLFDDPIVFPGQPGESHLHMFFGNTGTNANSNTESLTTSGDSSCPGGIMNRSGYWVAPIIDTRDGTPIMAQTSIFYYKTGYYGISANWVQDPPHGLRMISGNAKAMSSTDGLGQFECQDDVTYYNRTNSIINCAVGQRLHAAIDSRSAGTELISTALITRVTCHSLSTASVHQRIQSPFLSSRSISVGM